MTVVFNSNRELFSTGDKVRYVGPHDGYYQGFYLRRLGVYTVGNVDNSFITLREDEKGQSFVADGFAFVE